MLDKREPLHQGSLLNLGGITYTIEACIGRGGSALCYRASYPDALQKYLRHQVIIRELFPVSDGRIRRGEDGSTLTVEDEAFFSRHMRSFLNGNEAHVTFGHAKPETAGINLNSDMVNGTLYTILAFDGGVTLADEMDKLTDLRAIVTFLLTLLSTLADFHASGLLHMDISPDNVMLMPLPNGMSEDKRRVLLIDYSGVMSKNTDTQECYFSAKSGYSAPEVTLQNPHALCEATDLYSVCAILYRFVTGVALTRETMSDRRERVRLIDSSAMLQALSPDAQSLLRSILLRGLQPAPTKRYTNCAELSDALSSLRDALALSEKPACEAQIRAKSSAGKRRALIAAMITIFTLAVIFAMPPLIKQAQPAVVTLSMPTPDSHFTQPDADGNIYYLADEGNENLAAPIVIPEGCRLVIDREHPVQWILARIEGDVVVRDLALDVRAEITGNLTCEGACEVMVLAPVGGSLALRQMDDRFPNVSVTGSETLRAVTMDGLGRVYLEGCNVETVALPSVQTPTDAMDEWIAAHVVCFEMTGGSVQKISGEGCYGSMALIGTAAQSVDISSPHTFYVYLREGATVESYRACANSAQHVISGKSADTRIQSAEIDGGMATVAAGAHVTSMTASDLRLFVQTWDVDYLDWWHDGAFNADARIDSLAQVGGMSDISGSIGSMTLANGTARVLYGKVETLTARESALVVDVNAGILRTSDEVDSRACKEASLYTDEWRVGGAELADMRSIELYDGATVREMSVTDSRNQTEWMLNSARIGAMRLRALPGFAISAHEGDTPRVDNLALDIAQAAEGRAYKHMGSLRGFDIGNFMNLAPYPLALCGSVETLWLCAGQQAAGALSGEDATIANVKPLADAPEGEWKDYARSVSGK